MSMPANIALPELVEQSQSLTDTYYAILPTCESIDEIASLNNWYWSAMYKLWIEDSSLEQAV